MLTSSQIRAARGCLNISQLEIAKEIGISMNTFYRIEGDEELLARANLATIKKIKNFFEGRGIKFIAASEEDGSGAGLRYFPNKKKDD
ncbi:MAG: XRE family transcriptional regulator [Proteobacteria bacterium]|nr:XRE family transcriptional regulator [Pseudomonadota bacterium]